MQRAITLSTSLRVVGLCDAPDTMRKVLAKALGVDAAALDTQYLGMHHFGFITSARVAGHERLPEALDDRVLHEIERPLIGLSLSATRGNQIKAAHLLGINRNTLRKKMQQLRIKG
mgnify:CR=1 FL=1